jgi:hypothetical protein
LPQIRQVAMLSAPAPIAEQLDERLSRACVIEKNLAWSELGQQHCLNFGLPFPAQGLQRKSGVETPRIEGKVVRRDAEPAGLFLEIAARGGRAVARLVGSADTQGAPPTVKAISLID